MIIYAVLPLTIMEKVNKVNCRICERESAQTECKDCRYFLKHGFDESAIKSMHNDKKAIKIWKENEKIAESLAREYYDFVLENYDKKDRQKGTKEDFGFNVFVDGIRCGMDIIIPMLDDEMQAKVKDKINGMLKTRRVANYKLRVKELTS
jgi:hypothetical protein